MMIVGFTHLGRAIRRRRSDDSARQRTGEVASLRRHHDTFTQALTASCAVEAPRDRRIHRENAAQDRHTFMLDISFLLSLQNPRSLTAIHHLGRRRAKYGTSQVYLQQNKKKAEAKGENCHAKTMWSLEKPI